MEKGKGYVLEIYVTPWAIDILLYRPQMEET